MLGPHLARKDVELRPPTLEEAETYYKWMASPELSEFLVPPPEIHEGIGAKWLEEVKTCKTQIAWAIFGGGKHVGFTRLYSIDWVHRRAWGGTMLGERASFDQGFGTEAVNLRNEFTFCKTSIEKVQVQTFAENQRSREWMEKLGYRQYGLTRQEFLHEDQWHDMWLAEMLKTDWLARPK